MPLTLSLVVSLTNTNQRPPKCGGGLPITKVLMSLSCIGKPKHRLKTASKDACPHTEKARRSANKGICPRHVRARGKIQYHASGAVRLLRPDPIISKGGQQNLSPCRPGTSLGPCQPGVPDGALVRAVDDGRRLYAQHRGPLCDLHRAGTDPARAAPDGFRDRIPYRDVPRAVLRAVRLPA